MSPSRPRAVRVLLANNAPTSVTRIVAETATVWAELGVQTTVFFPIVDWLDFKLFEISRVPWTRKWRWIARLILETAVNAVGRRRWCGFRYYAVPRGVRAQRYWRRPRCSERTRETMTIIHHPYLLPHIVRRYARYDLPMVSVVHNNYEEEMRSPWPEAAAWKAHCVALERLFRVPRIATSAGGRRAAERLGIPVERVLCNGIDLRRFQPRPQRVEDGPITISLYCDTHVQKGQHEGVAALRELRSEPHVRLCSIGHVRSEYADVFHHNYGYLHREAYIRALQATDIFVYPSLYDGFPAPPLHALACGTALVTTAVEGVEEYASEGENCLTCAPGDIDAMRRQVRRLIDDAALRRRLQARGPETAQQYSVERTARQLLDMLGEIRQQQTEPSTALVSA